MNINLVFPPVVDSNGNNQIFAGRTQKGASIMSGYLYVFIDGSITDVKHLEEIEDRLSIPFVISKQLPRNENVEFVADIARETIVNATVGIGESSDDVLKSGITGVLVTLLTS
jgi:hypothetical protein